MGHDHGGHHHGSREGSHGGHHHGPRSLSRAFAIGVGLNAMFVVVEVVFGVMAQSVALVADAAHNFGDVLGLVLAWAAARLALRKPSPRRTYGLRRSTILAALANAILLLVSVGAIGWEAARRLHAGAESAQGMTMLVVAAAGVIVNAGAAALFAADRKTDVNVRGAYLHLLADAAVSLGVVVTGALLLYTGWAWLDPVASLLISAVVLYGTWKLLREALDLALDAVPEGVDVEQVRTYLASLPDVREVHDLHIWAMSTTETALTAHLVMPQTACSPAIIGDAVRELDTKFRIHHATLQVEAAESDAPCAQAPDDVV
jgi:cobalt-zinc-cadmium efflux system protein